MKTWDIIRKKKEPTTEEIFKAVQVDIYSKLFEVLDNLERYQDVAILKNKINWKEMVNE
jgi:hypothetical protein